MWVIFRAIALTDALGQDLAGLEYQTIAYGYNAFEAAQGTFTASISDQGVDSDGDGYYDALQLSVEVNILQAGLYRLDAALHDGGFIVAAQSEQFLAPSIQTLILDFDGRAIHRHGIDGPYQVVGLELSLDGESQASRGLFDTQSYAYSQFQPDLLLLGTLNDQGRDSDNDGLWDYLAVTLSLQVQQAANYAFNARLMDSQNREIVWASNTRFLPTGLQTVELLFDGRHIYGNGENGPYYLRDLSIYSGNNTFSQIEVGTTGAYSWLQFEPAAVVTGAITAGGQGVANANLFINAVANTLSDEQGVYRLIALEPGNYTVNLEADEALSPWDIWVDRQYVGEGNNITVELNLDKATEVNFVSTQISEPVAGDLDGNATVDGDDYAMLRNALGSCNGDSRYSANMDYDGDQCVSYADLRLWYTDYRAFLAASP